MHEVTLACERRIVNAWPAPETLLLDSFVLRFANGYSGRANSLSAITADATLSDARLDFAEALFRARGIAPCVRVTPLVMLEFADRLHARGYRLKDRSAGMVGGVGEWAHRDTRVRLAPQADASWLRGVSARQSGDKRDADDKLAAIVGRICVPAAFATLTEAGEPIGFGLCVAEPPMAEFASIVIDAAHRGRGFGRTLLGALGGWALAQGATEAFLQVDVTNAPALALYRRLGFETAYEYETLTLPA